MSSKTFLITKEWLNSCKTPAGGFTKAQFDCIGVEWPAFKGWHKQIIGGRIEPDLAEKFKLLSRKYKKTTKAKFYHAENYDFSNLSDKEIILLREKVASEIRSRGLCKFEVA